MSVFSENLRAFREARGLTQDSLSSMVGTSKQVLSRYENGIRVPKISMVEKLANALNVSINELTGKEDNPHKEPPPPKSPLDQEWRMISANVESMPDGQKQAILNIVKAAMAGYDERSNKE